MDRRLRNLNNFTAGMLDINLSRNPLAEEAMFIFNTVTRDHYQDAVIVEEFRYKKVVLVKKDVDLHYLQEWGENLVEDVDSLPWVISFTSTGLPRIPRMDDQIVVGGRKYTISLVKPTNRQIESVLLAMVYPERSEPFEELSIVQISRYLVEGNEILDILYTGVPTEYSVNGKAWKPFTSYVPSVPVQEVITIDGEESSDKRRILIDSGFSKELVNSVFETLYNRNYLMIRDKDGNVASKEIE